MLRSPQPQGDASQLCGWPSTSCSEMLNLPHIERDALYIIAGLEEATGDRIHQHLNRYYEQDRAESRVYNSLDNLASKELVEKSQKNRRTNLSSITRSGIQALEDHRHWKNQQLPDELSGPVQDEETLQGQPRYLTWPRESSCRTTDQ